MSLDWSTIKDLELPFGKVKKIEKSDGTVLWQKKSTLPPCLAFQSDSSFSVASYNSATDTTVAHYWNGTIEYSTNGSTWSTWNGSLITAGGDAGKGYTLYFRGRGNTHINKSNSEYARWQINGTDVSCTGNIETILDWESVKSGVHPVMDGYCFAYLFYGDSSLIECPMLPATTLSSHCYTCMFRNCTNITTPPELPATTLSDYCYYYMFDGCTNLMVVPALPATVMYSNCYAYMLYRCVNIKFSRTQIGDYQNEYRIPLSGTGTAASGWNSNMFSGTGGTWKSNPSINTIYYTSNTVA